MIFGINTKCDFSNLRQFWNITSGIYAKYHVQSCYYLFILLPAKVFVIFTWRYFKLSWNTTALSQSICRNFSCSSIKNEIIVFTFILGDVKCKFVLSKTLKILFSLVNVFCDWQRSHHHGHRRVESPHHILLFSTGDLALTWVSGVFFSTTAGNFSRLETKHWNQNLKNKSAGF